MASWCSICHRKLKADYIYYKGGKIHKKCKPSSGLETGYVPCGFLVKPATRFHQYFEREDSAKDYAQAYNYDTGEEVTITPIFKEGT